MSTEQLILEKFIQTHPVAVAKILEQHNFEEIVAIINEIPQNLAVSIMNEFEPFTAIKILELLDPATSAEIATHLPIQVISAFLRQINLELQESILNLMPKEIANPLRKSLQYPPNSAGSLADPFIPALPDDISVKEALHRIQNRKDRINHIIYIVNRNQVLCGVISLKDLLFENSQILLKEIMHKELIVVNADMTFQRILSHPGWQTSHMLPVVDENNILMGTIHHKTLKNIESKNNINKQSEEIKNTSNALGELFQIGLSGLIKTTTLLIQKDSEKNLNKTG